ncbi:carbon-nitrogen hydrolase family protein [Sinanaerobacter chloroacetimidivorans]|uniref:Carbon-nitrogen hydrolase family protein n=1 Tax=Sinanaerobacter chloroacetimidivorans TaxID=2818044 RepID=A0A8J7W653_9FIRM|nr:carbon-nitrogen hydrolase family protein [Sinanaerobacter chloroacetimidivorans]MBR0599895.1 carbon-nitrogen hydrolase family protein [Sinanaerobacter chloroacetimidivorans]
MKIHVTCVQMEPVLRDAEKNIKKMCSFIREAMETYPKTNLIVFPELIISGYECGKDFQRMAETVPDGASMKIIGALAKEYGVHIVYGFPERDSDKRDVLYNSAILIDNLGEVKGVYRKVHLFASEKEFFRAGCSYPVFDTSIGRLGMMICWDTAFPEVARSLALKGADLLIVSTNWEKPYLTDIVTKNQQDWDLVTRARAMDNCMYLVSANRIGFDETLGFFGRSNIIGPTGEAVEELLEEREGMISGELDYDIPIRLRYEYYTFFKDRRPDTFSELTKAY